MVAADLREAGDGMKVREQVVWLQHPMTGRWHAYAPGHASACGFTNKTTGEGQAEVPPGACWRCCRILGVKTNETRPNAPEPVEMRIEFLDGPLDGVRLRDLRVVMHDATNFTVVGQGSYTVKVKPTMASEVEHPAKETS